MKRRVQGVQFQVTLEHANRVHHRCLTIAHTCYTVIENALERGITTDAGSRNHRESIPSVTVLG